MYAQSITLNIWKVANGVEQQLHISQLIWVLIYKHAYDGHIYILLIHMHIIYFTCMLDIYISRHTTEVQHGYAGRRGVSTND